MAIFEHKNKPKNQVVKIWEGFFSSNTKKQKFLNTPNLKVFLVAKLKTAFL